MKCASHPSYPEFTGFSFAYLPFTCACRVSELRRCLEQRECITDRGIYTHTHPSPAEDQCQRGGICDLPRLLRVRSGMSVLGHLLDGLTTGKALVLSIAVHLGRRI